MKIKVKMKIKMKKKWGTTKKLKRVLEKQCKKKNYENKFEK